VPIAFFEIGVRRLRYGSGITVVNVQLRADETRLQAKVQGDVLGRLLKAIEREKVQIKKLERKGDVIGRVE
jgi:hypothetical protein